MDQEINQLQTAINNGWLPDDIRQTMRENQHISQITVESEPDTTENVYDEDGLQTGENIVRRLAVVYTVPNEDETTTTHRAIYDEKEVRRLLKAINA